MAIKVICNQKVDLTDDEWELYKKICDSYTTMTNKGSDLFQDLFSTNENGIITALIPPSKRQTSLEIFLFLMSIMQHQQIRLMWDEVKDVCDQMRARIKELSNDKL